jgi:hypothetical protein
MLGNDAAQRRGGGNGEHRLYANSSRVAHERRLHDNENDAGHQELCAKYMRITRRRAKLGVKVVHLFFLTLYKKKWDVAAGATSASWAVSLCIFSCGLSTTTRVGSHIQNQIDRMEYIALLLLDHLNMGDVFRLRRALGRQGNVVVFEETAALHIMTQRMRLKRPLQSLREVSAKMIHRCVECGIPCRMAPYVCIRCRRDLRGLKAMVSREYIRQECVNQNIRGKRFFVVLHSLTVVKRTAQGAFLYWKRDADEIIRLTRSK